jgi:hypothetical protein
VNPLDWVKVGVPAAAALALGILLLVARGELAATRSALATANATLGTQTRDLAICRGNTASLLSAVDAANRAVAEAAGQGRAADAKARAQIAAAAEANRALAARAAALQAATVRPPGTDACANAERILDREIHDGPLE